MINKALLKQIPSYKQKMFRDEDQVFVVEGEKMVAEALAVAEYEKYDAHRRMIEAGDIDALVTEVQMNTDERTTK